MREQELSAAFEVFALLWQQFRLDSLSNVLQRPSAVPDDVETVDHNLGVWQQLFRKIQVLSVHVHHEVLHLISVWESPQILINLRVITRWKNINNLPVNGIGQDALKLAILGIAPKFVDGQNLGQQRWFSEFK